MILYCEIRDSDDGVGAENSIDEEKRSQRWGLMLYVQHNGYNVFRGYSVARTKLPCVRLKVAPLSWVCTAASYNGRRLCFE